MKTCLIITPYGNGNFGNKLQNYAVQKILENKGYNVETLKNYTEKSRLHNFYLNLRNDMKFGFSRRRKFLKFNKYIHYTKDIVNVNKIPNKLKKYDFYIYGSDQVWNPNFGGISDLYLGAFNFKKTNIAFSASFGVQNVPNEWKDKISQEIKKFKAISVREDRGKEIVEELTERTDVEVLVDPTMLLDVEEWNKLVKRPIILKNDKFILNYFLGEISEEIRKQIMVFAKENNCEIINILDPTSPFYNCGPSEFLYLEKNAFLICTDSFHSSVFAILYNRPFMVFDRMDQMAKMNSRIETLLSKFHLEDRKYKGELTESILLTNYDKTFDILNEEKKKAFSFIENNLN